MILKSFELLEPRLKVLVYVATLGDEENAFELYRFVPNQYEKPLVEATKELLSIPTKDRRRVILTELKKLIQAQKLHPLGEIDSGWFLEALKKERPQTIGLILRHLPGDKVRYLLEHFPPEIREKLPKIKEASKVSDSLIGIVRNHFESQFPTLAPPKNADEISLQHLYFVKTNKLLSFFRDLGLEQLAKAFKGVHKSALKALLNRLTIKDAKEFQMRIKSFEKLTTRELREAQMLLLNLPIETIEPEALFLEVGMAFFAKSVSREDSQFIRALQYKLPTKFGYVLMRYVDGNMSSFKPHVAEWVKKHVLEKFNSYPTE